MEIETGNKETEIVSWTL